MEKRQQEEDVAEDEFHQVYLFGRLRQWLTKLF
jgi:hypothetical protein